MNLILKRHFQSGEAIHGTLYVENIPYCNTLENSFSALPKGEYPIVWHFCKQTNQLVPLVVNNSYNQSSYMNSHCRYCKLVYEVNNNSTYPRHCPQIKVGNGIVKRRDGRILVGKLVTKGCLIHSQAYYDKVCKQLKMLTNNKQQATLIVT